VTNNSTMTFAYNEKIYKLKMDQLTNERFRNIKITLEQEVFVVAIS